MKTRIKLKGWVETTLILINFILFIILGSESAGTKTFIITHLSTLILFMFNCYIISRYGRLLD